MKLNRSGSNWNRNERNKLNENWSTIEGNYNDTIGKITEEVVGKLIDSAKLIWKEPVDTVDDLPIRAETGETRLVRKPNPTGVAKVYRYDGGKWVEIQEIDATAINEIDRRLSNQLDGKLSKNGGEIDGSIHLKSPPTDNTNSLNHPSSRVILESYIKSNGPNNHDGDVLQLLWRNHGAKPFIGWWDAATNPEKPELKAWIGAHDLANNPESDPHDHWSIEVSDSTGQLHTRLAIPFDEDHTNIKTSDADFTVGYGTLRVAAERGSNRDLEFADRTNADPKEARFSFRLDSTNNFRIIARDDDGNPIAAGSPFFIERLTGRVGFGTTNPTHQVHMRSANQALRIEGTSGTTLTPLFAIDHKNSSRRVLGTKVDGDQDYRFMIETDGHLSWGSGNGRDSNLYRVRSGRLATNSDLLFESQKGPIVEDVHGGKWRIKVNSDGTLDTISL